MASFKDAHEALDAARAQFGRSLQALGAAIHSEFPAWASDAAAHIAAAQREVTDGKSDPELAAMKRALEEAAEASVRGFHVRLEETLAPDAFEMGRLPADLDDIRRELRVFLTGLTRGVYTALEKGGYTLEGDGLLPVGSIDPGRAFDDLTIAFYRAATELQQQRRRWADELARESIEQRWYRL